MNREEFFKHQKFAVVGNSKNYPFAKFTYAGLKQQGKTVFAIDPSGTTIEGDKAFGGFETLPQKVDAAIFELAPEETATWVQRAVDVGIRNIWIHMETDTPEAVAIAKKAGAQVFTGTCAVMYVMPKKFPHNIHGWIMKRLGKY